MVKHATDKDVEAMITGMVKETRALLAKHRDFLLGLSRDEIVAKLWDAEPRISVQTEDSDGLLFNPMTLTDEEVRMVETRMRVVLHST